MTTIRELMGQLDSPDEFTAMHAQMEASNVLPELLALAAIEKFWADAEAAYRGMRADAMLAERAKAKP